jgi:hypothetical protein
MAALAGAWGASCFYQYFFITPGILVRATNLARLSALAYLQFGFGGVVPKGRNGQKRPADVIGHAIKVLLSTSYVEKHI